MEFLRHSRRTAFSSSVSWSNRKIYTLWWTHTHTQSIVTMIQQAACMHANLNLYDHSKTSPTLRGAGLLTGSGSPCCKSWSPLPELELEEDESITPTSAPDPSTDIDLWPFPVLSARPLPNDTCICSAMRVRRSACIIQRCRNVER